jgi:hypothetical protein
MRELLSSISLLRLLIYEYIVPSMRMCVRGGGLCSFLLCYVAYLVF